MHIGILQTGHAPDAVQAEFGDYFLMFEHLLAEKPLSFTTWNVVDGEFPSSHDAAQGWLITGSRHGVYEDHDWIAPLEAFIRDAHDKKTPIVGICFGHQIIAQALGGTVEKFSGGWRVGCQPYEFDGETLSLNAWHQDQVTTLPSEARVLASGPNCKYAALAYGDHIFTIQPHPEFSDQTVKTLIETRGRGVVPDELLDQAAESLGGTSDSAKVADKISSLFNEAANVKK